MFEDATSPIVARDATNRTSTGIGSSPLIPVGGDDDDEKMITTFEDATSPNAARDATNRTSTGIGSSPLIPVDGDDEKGVFRSLNGGGLRDNLSRDASKVSSNSLELLRQLESCVRELREVIPLQSRMPTFNDPNSLIALGEN